MGFKFIHAADLHLDSPLRGLERYESAPADEVREATRRALRSLVELAIAEQVAFVVIAGDIFDGIIKDQRAALFFNARMNDLLNAPGGPIRVYMILGNHDAESGLGSHLRLPANVTCFPARSAKTVDVEGLAVAIHGRSYPTRDVTDNIASAYPTPVPGSFNIGLLHTALQGAPGHASYAPVSQDALANHGYQYWALGHVHAGGILQEHPWIVFAGCSQGRHSKETGAKGCYLVEVDEGEVIDVQFRRLDVVQWETLAVSITEADQPEDVVARIGEAVADAHLGTDDRILAARIELDGDGPARRAFAAHPEQWATEVQSRVGGDAAGRAWVGKIDLAPLPQVVQGSTGLGTEGSSMLLSAIESSLGSDALRAALKPAMDRLREKLPHEVIKGDDAAGEPGRDPADSGYIERQQEQAMALLREQLMPGGDL